MNALRIVLIAIIVTSLLAWTQADQDRWRPERRHPGHMMQVDYRPAKDAFALGAPVEVVLTITNVGTTPFQFMRGGRQRGARDNQFAFNAQFGRGMLPDVGDPINFGGLGGYVRLEPGDHIDIPVDLTKWFAFEKTGRYELRGSYFMAFSDPDTTEYSHIWEDFAGGEFSVVIRDAEESDVTG